MRRYELLRITIYVIVGLSLAYALDNTPLGGYIPESIGRNMGRIVIAFVLLMMLTPVVFLIADIIDWTRETGSLIRALRRFTPTGVIGFIVVVNMFLFFVLAIFFDGGAFPWGESSGGRYWIVANFADKEISESWFRFGYWQGLSAWAGMGIYGAGAFGYKFFKSMQNEQEKQAIRDAGGLIFTIAWLAFVLWNGAKILT